jgi:DNA uptake protein ComE-like DNA-binding protein
LITAKANPDAATHPGLFLTQEIMKKCSTSIERNFMKHHYIFIALSAAALVLNANLSRALENNTAADQEAALKAKANHNVVKSHIEARRKAAARIDPVDINNGTRKQLQKLPGVSDVVANKIIAGRPYASSRDLLTRNIINKEIYDNIRRRIYVKPASKSAAKNAANSATIKQ